MKELIDIENSFLSYDYTKNQQLNQPEPRMVITTTSSKLTFINESNLLKRVGDKFDQSKYRSQGYYELNTYDTHDDPITASTTTTTTTTTTVTKISTVSI